MSFLNLEATVARYQEKTCHLTFACCPCIDLEMDIDIDIGIDV